VLTAVVKVSATIFAELWTVMLIVLYRFNSLSSAMATMIALKNRAHRAELIIIPHGSMTMKCSTFMYC
jgi:hypothetical protein